MADHLELHPDGSVLRNRSFLLLWIGEGVSHVGSQVAHIALPLTAILTLDASVAEVGLLSALRYAPFLLSLPAGVYVDRWPRRRTMIFSNVGRAMIIGLVPVAHFGGFLSMSILFVVAVGSGFLRVLFDLSYGAYLPTVVPRVQLLRANSVLEATESASTIGGVGMGGILVQLLGAPAALIVDAVSFVGSAACLAAIRVSDGAEDALRKTRSFFAELRDGWAVIRHTPELPPLIGYAATSNFAFQGIYAVFPVFALRELELSAAAVGIVMASAGAGAVVGASVVGWLRRSIAFGTLLLTAAVCSSLASATVGLASGSRGVALASLMSAFAVWGLGLSATNVLGVTLRQTIVPTELLGRVSATSRTFTFAALPLGAGAAGAMASFTSLRTALLSAGLVNVAASLWLFASPIRQRRTLD